MQSVDKMKNMNYVGIPFIPADAELIQILHHKITNPNYNHPSIVVADVYKQEPWSLPWDPAENRFFHGNERYYFGKRKGTGRKTKRTLDIGGDLEGAAWRPNQKATPILDEGNGNTIGFVLSLTFFFKNKSRGDWIMHEYLIDDPNSVEEYWFLSRFKYTGKGTPQSMAVSGGLDPLPLIKWQKTIAYVEEPQTLQEAEGLMITEGGSSSSLQLHGLGQDCFSSAGDNNCQLYVDELEAWLENRDFEKDECFTSGSGSGSAQLEGLLEKM
ncbi:hypothetical protein SLEP1_g17374 [Rubroshorea leprosula]|uniref:NAC domain-containing protein n=1 Tax=Rubroshorea leprosula TaxID=152421 RepID=A0AAV5IXR9_9ROSI|nr:hypothetical protein SLEP1_g17374 [Rubroshorea leprosula]